MGGMSEKNPLIISSLTSSGVGASGKEGILGFTLPTIVALARHMSLTSAFSRYVDQDRRFATVMAWKYVFLASLACGSLEGSFFAARAALWKILHSWVRSGVHQRFDHFDGRRGIVYDLSRPISIEDEILNQSSTSAGATGGGGIVRDFS